MDFLLSLLSLPLLLLLFISLLVEELVEVVERGLGSAVNVVPAVNCIEGIEGNDCFLFIFYFEATSF